MGSRPLIITLRVFVQLTIDFFAAREDFSRSVDQFLSTFRDCTGEVIFVRGSANACERKRIGVHSRALALFRDGTLTIDFFAPREDSWLRPKAAL